MQRFNENPSPKTKNRRIQAIQVLGRLNRDHPAVRDAILADLSLTTNDLTETLESLYQQCLDHAELEECGSCGHNHRPDFCGDCRNDDERFPGW